MIRSSRKKLLFVLALFFLVLLFSFFNLLVKINFAEAGKIAAFKEFPTVINVNKSIENEISESSLSEDEMIPVNENEDNKSNGNKVTINENKVIAVNQIKPEEKIINKQEVADKQEFVEIINNKEIKNLDVGKPVRIIIPKINVDADVLHIGLTDNGQVGAPEGAYDVSWFDLGPKPGEKGNSLISGHSGIWKDGSHSLFDYLHTLSLGDVIYIIDDKGIKRSFIIMDTKIYNKDDTVPELFEDAESINLNIITCHGNWLKSEGTYYNRFVVFTKMI